MTNAEMDLIDGKFSTRLVGLMKMNKVKHSELAKALEVDRNTVYAWAGKGKLPNGYNLYQLARYFGVSIDFMLGKSDTKGGRKE